MQAQASTSLPTGLVLEAEIDVPLTLPAVETTVVPKGLEATPV